MVEDVYFLAMELKHWLEDAGASVVGPVPSIRHALELIEEHSISGALLDIYLRDREEVYPVADKLAERGIPFVFATGHAYQLEDTPYRDHPTVAKPWFRHSLLHKLTEVFSR